MSIAIEHVTAQESPVAPPRAASNVLTADDVWREVRNASFAVLSYVTPRGEPRSSGVMYTMAGDRMYVVVAVDSWKARHIEADGHVAVTVPVRRGGVLSLLFPIPPATISFHGRAIVRPAGALEGESLPKQLTSMVPPARRELCRVIEIQPEAKFVTYGLGVSLAEMRDPAVARARMPIDSNHSM
jgi:hypothetical protein